MITLGALSGYLLEDVLARLLYDNGYRLLVDPSQDPDALTRDRHGLVVRGRGADHQVDALGELMLPIPFSLPVRLFVEAKFRKSKATLRDVRNAHGVLHDVNEHFTSTRGSSLPLRRHHYRYALCSTSGFTAEAQRYALAQQISLVDLSGPAFRGIRDAVELVAGGLLERAVESGLTRFPLEQTRTAVRLALGTWTADGDVGHFSREDSFENARERALLAAELNPALWDQPRLPADVLADVAAALIPVASEDLMLGFPAGPFVLALRSQDPDALSRYVAEHGADVQVDIRFARRGEVTGDWVIVPADGSNAFAFRFALPRLVSRDPGVFTWRCCRPAS